MNDSEINTLVSKLVSDHKENLVLNTKLKEREVESAAIYSAQVTCRQIIRLTGLPQFQRVSWEKVREVLSVK